MDTSHCLLVVFPPPVHGFNRHWIKPDRGALTFVEWLPIYERMKELQRTLDLPVIIIMLYIITRPQTPNLQNQWTHFYVKEKQNRDTLKDFALHLVLFSVKSSSWFEWFVQESLAALSMTFWLHGCNLLVCEHHWTCELWERGLGFSRGSILNTLICAF